MFFISIIPWNFHVARIIFPESFGRTTTLRYWYSLKLNQRRALKKILLRHPLLPNSFCFWLFFSFPLFVQPLNLQTFYLFIQQFPVILWITLKSNHYLCCLFFYQHHCHQQYFKIENLLVQRVLFYFFTSYCHIDFIFRLVRILFYFLSYRITEGFW